MKKLLTLLALTITAALLAQTAFAAVTVDYKGVYFSRYGCATQLSVKAAPLPNMANRNVRFTLATSWFDTAPYYRDIVLDPPPNPPKYDVRTNSIGAAAVSASLRPDTYIVTARVDGTDADPAALTVYRNDDAPLAAGGKLTLTSVGFGDWKSWSPKRYATFGAVVDETVGAGEPRRDRLMYIDWDHPGIQVLPWMPEPPFGLPTAPGPVVFEASKFTDIVYTVTPSVKTVVLKGNLGAGWGFFPGWWYHNMEFEATVTKAASAANNTFALKIYGFGFPDPSVRVLLYELPPTLIRGEGNATQGSGVVMDF